MPCECAGTLSLHVVSLLHISPTPFGHSCFKLTTIIAIEYLRIGERTNCVNLAIMSAMSFTCFVLIGLATLYLEMMSMPERIYLYSFPYNMSLGMYDKSN